MNYTAAEYNGRDTVLKGVSHFSPENTLNCGQCFRWDSAGGVYAGVAHGRRLELSVSGDTLTLKDVAPPEFESVWKDYFDLGRDYGALRERFAGDAALKAATEFSPGLRLMRQEPWETLITFILSQNSNIPRIKGMVARLCECFGEPLPGGGYAFPCPCVLARLSAERLSPVRCGYRAEYITDAARRVSGGGLDLDALRGRPSAEVFAALTRIRGVGPKVADCVLLYGFGRVERYPMDVWMKRAMAALYPGGFPEAFSGEAGIAQQFLFRYARENKIK